MSSVKDTRYFRVLKMIERLFGKIKTSESEIKDLVDEVNSLREELAETQRFLTEHIIKERSKEESALK